MARCYAPLKPYMAELGMRYFFESQRLWKKPRKS